MGLIFDMSNYIKSDIYSVDQYPRIYFSKIEDVNSSDFSGSDLIWVERKGCFGYLNRNTQQLLKPGLDYQDALSFSCGRGVVKRNDKWGAIDEKGDIVVDLLYDSLTPYKDDVTFCKIGGKIGCLGLDGEIICKPIYDYISPFKEGYAVVKRKGKYGYVDKEGKEVIAPMFDRAESFSTGLALVEIEGNLSYIDSKGDVKIQAPRNCPYRDGGNFENGYASVKQKGKWGVINRKGEKVVPCRYDEVGKIQDDIFEVKQEDKWGYVLAGKEEQSLIPCELMFPLAEDEKFDQEVISKIKTHYKDKLSRCKTIMQSEKCYDDCKEEIARYKTARMARRLYLKTQMSIEEIRNKLFNKIDNIE